MWEFATGTDRQYAALRASLEDGLCHVYNAAYPPGCSRGNGRIGFEKEREGTYALHIDRGLACFNPQAPELFRDWLSAGTLRFLDFTDLAEFLRSLRSLYE